jgi:hypothetical protein
MECSRRHAFPLGTAECSASQSLTGRVKHVNWRGLAMTRIEGENLALEDHGVSAKLLEAEK